MLVHQKNRSDLNSCLLLLLYLFALKIFNSAALRARRWEGAQHQNPQHDATRPYVHAVLIARSMPAIVFAYPAATALRLPAERQPTCAYHAAVWTEPV